MHAILMLLLLMLLPLAAHCSDEISTLRLSPRESFRDFIPLSAANISIALKDKQPWLLHLHHGSIFADFKRMAASVRGLVRFGLISADDADAVAALKMEPEKHEFRALAFGFNKTQNFLDTSIFNEALDFASRSVPEDKIVIVKEQQDLKKLLTTAMSAKPAKFTVLFTIRDDTLTLMQRVVSQKLSRTFAFGVVVRAADEGVMDAVGLKGVQWPIPCLTVLAVQPDGKVQSARINEKKRDWDSIDFAELLRFLVEFNRQFRPNMPGDHRSSDLRILHMTEELENERLVFDIQDELNKTKSSPSDAKEEL